MCQHRGSKRGEALNRSESKYFNTAIKMDEALIELLEKKSFEYITVKEICEKAGVNRSTFYLHYETVGDLLEETTRYMINKFLSYFSDRAENASVNVEISELENLNFITEKYLNPYLSFMKENKQIFLASVNHTKALGFERVYKRLFETVFNPILERFDYPEEYRKYVMLFYLNGITAIVTKWLQDDCRMETDKIADVVTVCVLGKNNILSEIIDRRL